MSKQSEAVKKWRNNFKNRVIDAMGGKCVICGYSKCPHALALHHLDPSEKDFSLGAIRASPKNWVAITNELKKCILLCHNCHSEIHCEMINLPEIYATFNEEYLDYKKFENKSKHLIDLCPICGQLKPSQFKYCSSSCSSKSRYKVDWDNIDLVEELKTKSILKLSEEIGCSDGAVHKRMKKLGLK